MFFTSVPLMMGWQDFRRLRSYYGGSAQCAAFWALCGARQMAWPDRTRPLPALTPSPDWIAALNDALIGVGDAASEAVWNAHPIRMNKRYTMRG
jgi:hypothetical protein